MKHRTILLLNLCLVCPILALAEQLTDFRFRSDFGVPLNANSGWAAGLNERAILPVDQPFRLRIQLQSPKARDELRHYFLEFSYNGGPWEPVIAADFPYPDYASPLVSIVSAPFSTDEPTGDLLPHADLETGEDGRLVNLSPVTPVAGENGVASEWEWPLVVRGIADGPRYVRSGDRIEFRVTRLHGPTLDSLLIPALEIQIPDQHISGTYVESPGRIGPWQVDNRDFYFIMEPTETDNRFLMVKSPDNGRTWVEVDPDNRPPARDLEAVDARLAGSTIHIVHQESDVWYHEFATSEAGSTADRWLIQSEWIAKPAKPPVQSVAIERRSNGDLIALHGDGPGITIRQRTAAGTWKKLHHIDRLPRLNGLQALIDRKDRLHFLYTSSNGTAWTQVLDPENRLQPALLISDNLGQSEADVGSVLPPVLFNEGRTIVFCFREKDGRLYERRLNLAIGEMTPKIAVTEQPVVQNAVDSDQAGASLVAVGDQLGVLFIEDSSRDLFFTASRPNGTWTQPQMLMEGIDGCWIRALPAQDGRIAYAVDAGSKGGAGRNRFGFVSFP